jgi:hypothetical protein
MKRKIQRTPVTPEYLRSLAQREARFIGKYGWRPSRKDLALLRTSKRDVVAYRTMLRAWRSAGFKTGAIQRLAGRGRNRIPPKPHGRQLAAVARADDNRRHSHHHEGYIR